MSLSGGVKSPSTRSYLHDVTATSRHATLTRHASHVTRARCHCGQSGTIDFVVELLTVTELCVHWQKQQVFYLTIACLDHETSIYHIYIIKQIILI